jgi:hypothetical protein
MAIALNLRQVVSATLDDLSGVRTGGAESPARGVTLLTGGFNRRMMDTAKPKSPARGDTFYLTLDEKRMCRPWRDFETGWALRCRGLKPPVNKMSPLRGFENTCDV